MYGIKLDRDHWWRVTKNGRIVRSCTGEWNLFNTPEEALEMKRKLERLEQAKAPEITVDYALLRKQLNALARAEPSMRDGDIELIDGVFSLLDAILRQKPFREVKDG